jgi:hypothetical protein
VNAPDTRPAGVDVELAQAEDGIRRAARAEEEAFVGWRAAQRATSDAWRRRSDLIVELVRAGIPESELARITGLTRRHVQVIVESRAW